MVKVPCGVPPSGVGGGVFVVPELELELPPPHETHSSAIGRTTIAATKVRLLGIEANLQISAHSKR